MIKLLNDCKYFNIVILALNDCFNELNIPNTIVNEIIPNDINLYIICTTHQLQYFPKNYISYNFEQLTTDKKWSSQFFNNLRNAKQVWDYSLENIKVLNTYKINTIHLPLGYNKTMEYNKNNDIKTIDYSFIGCLNETRINKLKNLINIYYKSPEKILITNDCWDFNIYNKIKIGINLHFYKGNTILEIHRIILMIANKVYVLSETSDDKWYDEIYSNMIKFINTQNKNELVNVGLEFLRKPINEQKNILDLNYNYLKTNCLYLNYIKLVYKDLIFN